MNDGLGDMGGGAGDAAPNIRPFWKRAMIF